MCGLMSDLDLENLEKSMVIHDTECPFWDQVPVSNRNLKLWILPRVVTIHQLTTTLSTSKNDLFPGHNQLLTTGADDPTL